MFPQKDPTVYFSRSNYMPYKEQNAGHEIYTSVL